MAIEIDDRYLDLDFSKQPEFTAGCNGNGDPGLFQSFDSTQAILTRTQVIDEIAKVQASGGGLERHVWRVFNQKNEGSCVGNSSTQGLMVVSTSQFGRDGAIDLSAIATYKQIGSSPNSGAMVSDSLVALQKVGTLPRDTPENRAKFGAHVMPDTGFYTPWPEGWKETAKKFRIVESTVVRSVEALWTALLCGCPVVVGRQGHSILYVGLVYRDGKIYALYVNSWGQWGMAAGHMEYGFGLDSESLVRQSASWAYAIRSAVDFR